MVGNDKHPGMMGDGTEEQNLGQTGNPAARIGRDEVEEAFDQHKPGETKPEQKPTTNEEGRVTDTVSNDVSDAKQAPEDTMPKDNSHNFN